MASENLTKLSVQSGTSNKYTISYCIPTKNRKKLAFLAALSALKPTYCLQERTVEVCISDNQSDIQVNDQIVFLAKSFPSSSIIYIYLQYGVPIVNNWLSSLMMASGDIVKLLFSDDLLLQEPSDDSFAELTSNPECAFISTPAWIGDECNHGLNYMISSRMERVRVEAFIDGILHKPHLYPHSPCAYYFRKSDLIAALSYIHAVPGFAPTLSNGAGADAMAIIMLLDSGFKYSIFDPSGLVLFRAHNGSITINDHQNKIGLVDSLRLQAFSYYMRNKDLLRNGFFEYRKYLLTCEGLYKC